MAKRDPKGKIEIRIQPSMGKDDGISSVAAGTPSKVNPVLSPEQINLIQTSITQLMFDFRPEPLKPVSGKMTMKELAIELSFGVEIGTGSVLSLIIGNLNANAGIKATATWKI